MEFETSRIYAKNSNLAFEFANMHSIQMLFLNEFQSDKVSNLCMKALKEVVYLEKLKKFGVGLYRCKILDFSSEYFLKFYLELHQFLRSILGVTIKF